METAHTTFRSTEGEVPRGIKTMAESLRCDAESWKILYKTNI